MSQYETQPASTEVRAERHLTIMLVRHGETEWNAEGRLQGQTDVPLSDTGREQARLLGRRLRRLWFPEKSTHRRQIAPAAVYVSDLARATETAHLLLENAFAAPELDLPHAVPPTHRMPELRERFFGKFEGLTAAEAARAFPGETHHTEGEMYDAVYARMLRVLEHIWSEHAANPKTDPPATALIVGHGGSLRTLLARAIHAGPEGAHYFSLGNTAISVTEFTGPDLESARGRIRLLNDTSHLEP